MKCHKIPYFAFFDVLRLKEVKVCYKQRQNMELLIQH